MLCSRSSRSQASVASFQWHPDERPPWIEPHSKAKLEVLRAYLRQYFDRLAVSRRREELKLDLVDGFAGGGTFQDGDKILPGSPLVMLEEAEAARHRLNEGRDKKLEINCRFYFIDKERSHTDHLRQALKERDYKIDEKEITVQTGLFEDNLEGVIRSIRERQPRAGRAIFLLDQTGFSCVKLDLVRRIFSELATAEVILTFAADALINHLAKTPEMIKMVAPIKLTESHIHDLIEYRNGDGGRALIQRTLRNQIRGVTQAAYDTPFFIRPEISRRALWFIHLSRHPTARDVMIQQHWNIQNTFEHYGTGGFGMLGWDTIRDSETIPLFEFGKLDEQEMRKQLLNSLPGKLFGLASEQPVTIDAIHHALANQTAARFSDLDEAILQLVRGGEFDILDSNGKARSKSLKKIKSTDRIALPLNLFIPGLF
ncbi:MAG: three-Cys-motif partner protein TcmP [Synechococcus sp. SB0673_bin_10]|nr:three-Cys-motif partner protein TcmP [Synechococcus sp. SB0667_bin_8]MYG63290.1 three-Cys-motif partner protein TcmP [Synechococcus sp. SB0675_bin_7]MYI71223.1 three-Cys-motif partner protein TcmP [Synechococcus sp. SB0673_bin_10]MYK85331.1 three-Cys-motif partner protein TcmP [Synechococcus sp. SB0669_bin_7]